MFKVSCTRKTPLSLHQLYKFTYGFLAASNDPWGAPASNGFTSSNGTTSGMVQLLIVKPPYYSWIEHFFHKKLAIPGARTFWRRRSSLVVTLVIRMATMLCHCWQQLRQQRHQRRASWRRPRTFWAKTRIWSTWTIFCPRPRPKPLHFPVWPANLVRIKLIFCLSSFILNVGFLFFKSHRNLLLLFYCFRSFSMFHFGLASLHWVIETLYAVWYTVHQVVGISNIYLL